MAVRTDSEIMLQYWKLDIMQRLEILFKKYGTIINLVRGYEDRICDKLFDIYSSWKKADSANLGICRRNPGVSNPTLNIAVDRNTISDQIRYADTDDFLRGIDEKDYYKNVILSARKIRQDYSELERTIRCIPASKREVLEDVLLGRKSIYDIADMKGIQYESAKMMLYRIRFDVKKQAAAYIREDEMEGA